MAPLAKTVPEPEVSDLRFLIILPEKEGNRQVAFEK